MSTLEWVRRDDSPAARDWNQCSDLRHYGVSPMDVATMWWRPSDAAWVYRFNKNMVDHVLPVDTEDEAKAVVLALYRMGE